MNSLKYQDITVQRLYRFLSIRIPAAMVDGLKPRYVGTTVSLNPEQIELHVSDRAFREKIRVAIATFLLQEKP